MAQLREARWVRVSLLFRGLRVPIQIPILNLDSSFQILSNLLNAPHVVIVEGLLIIVVVFGASKFIAFCTDAVRDRGTGTLDGGAISFARSGWRRANTGKARARV